MLLYEHPLSSYAQKVKIALREKGLEFDVETPQGLGSGKSAGPFAASSPRLEVPALIDGDTRIFDSTIILEYLEDKWPIPPLLPRDPTARAEARMIEDVCDTLYEAINWGLGEIRWFKRAEGEQADRMTATAARQTAEIQAWLAVKLGTKPWFNGDAFGWADISVAPYLNRSTMAWEPPTAGRWHGGAIGFASVRQWLRLSRNSRLRPAAWAMAPSAWRRAPSDASTAITASNG